MSVRNIARVEVGKCISRIDGRTPQRAPPLVIERPKRLQCGRIREVRPQRYKHDPHQRAARDVFHHLQLFYEFEPRYAVKSFQVLVLVQMFHVTAHVISVSHHAVMARADEEFGSALELPLCVAAIWQDQAIDAAAVLMEPVHIVPDRARFHV